MKLQMSTEIVAWAKSIGFNVIPVQTSETETEISTIPEQISGKTLGDIFNKLNEIFENVLELGFEWKNAIPQAYYVDCENVRVIIGKIEH